MSASPVCPSETKEILLSTNNRSLKAGKKKPAVPPRARSPPRSASADELNAEQQEKRTNVVESSTDTDYDDLNTNRGTFVVFPRKELLTEEKKSPKKEIPSPTHNGEVRVRKEKEPVKRLTESEVLIGLQEIVSPSDPNEKYELVKRIGVG